MAGFDSCLFDSSSLFPADGAASDAGPQQSPMPPKPKLQQPVGEAALGQQWTQVQVIAVSAPIARKLELQQELFPNWFLQIFSQRQPTHSKTLDTVLVDAKKSAQHDFSDTNITSSFLLNRWWRRLLLRSSDR
jgi:hypothetical protein